MLHCHGVNTGKQANLEAADDGESPHKFRNQAIVDQIDLLVSNSRPKHAHRQSQREVHYRARGQHHYMLVPLSTAWTALCEARAECCVHEKLSAAQPYLLDLKCALFPADRGIRDCARLPPRPHLKQQ